MDLYFLRIRSLKEKMWRFEHGIRKFDERTKEWELVEGTKHHVFLDKRLSFRGKFGYIKELESYELVEGVESVDRKKTRGKWLYDSRKSEMKAVKVMKKCEYAKCSRDSLKSKRVFRLCGKCEKVFYCSRRHQRNDWEYHKYVCSYY